VIGAKSMGRHTLSLAGEVGANPTGTVPPYDPFQLGGFQRLSGYRIDQLNASEIAFGRAVYSYQFARLPSVLGRGVYAGGSLEAGAVHSPLDPSIGSKWRPAVGLFVGADTFLGPVYLGWGKSLIDDSRSMYFLIGRP
jgi:NTE family protein